MIPVCTVINIMCAVVFSPFSSNEMSAAAQTFVDEFLTYTVSLLIKWTTNGTVAAGTGEGEFKNGKANESVEKLHYCGKRAQCLRKFDLTTKEITTFAGTN